jgi:hypothetical protein
MRRCKHILENGKQCRATPQRNKDYCYFHDPDTKDRFLMSSQKGGESKKNVDSQSLESIKLETPKDVVTLLAKTISELRAGKIEVRAANAIACLSNVLLRAFQYSDIDAKVSEIESILLKR